MHPKVTRAVACGALLLASATQAQIDCSTPSTVTPTGPNVAVSTANPQYFTYKGQLLPLVGMSHEYVCHIPQGSTQNAEYCTLGNYPSVFSTLKTNKNNVYRIWTIFNHSPGTAVSTGPWNNEQPFVRSGTKWDVRTINIAYIDNLEKVVCEAYKNDIVVEVTLLDPWDGDWTTGPFHPNNTVSYPDPANVAVTVTPGFSVEPQFMSFENGTSDTTSAVKEARKAQRIAIRAVVNRLKRWPNVIWEVANESDFEGPTAANLNTFQNAMISHIRAFDTTHPIMVNAHTPSTFAWNLTNATAASLHYTDIVGALYGAIELQRDASLATARSGMPLAFNENRFIPSTVRTTADGVRSEAWEFMLNEGGLFDAYSINRGDPAAQAASAQLKFLYNFLITPTSVGGVPTNISNLSAMQQTSCNGASDWCRGVPVYANPDQGTCATPTANAYWATMKSSTDLALYIHHGVRLGGTYGGYAPRLCGNGTSSGYRTTTFQYRVPQSGCWAAVWIDPATGTKLAGGLVNLVANTWYSPATYPFYKHDIAFLARLVPGAC